MQTGAHAQMLARRISCKLTRPRCSSVIRWRYGEEQRKEIHIS